MSWKAKLFLGIGILILISCFIVRILSKVSWGDYFAGIGIVISIYVAFVVTIFRKQLEQFGSSPRNKKPINDNSSRKIGWGKNFKLWIIFVILLVIVSVFGYYFISNHNSEVPVNPLIEPIMRNNTSTTPQIHIDTITPSILEKLPHLDSSSKEGTKLYSFGKYVGTLKDSIPNGQGTMYYYESVQIAQQDSKTHYAEKGYYFVGTWFNGDIELGTLYDKNGKEKEKIFAGKRNTPIDLDKQ